MSEKKRKQKGEKYDAYLVKDIEPISQLMSCVIGDRTDNEAVCKFDLEMSALEAYIEKKNSENPTFKYTFFHVICAALARTIAERKKMNYFIRNNHFYERKEISFAAVAKKQKLDGAQEGLIIMKYDKDSDESPMDQMHNSICRQVYDYRKSKDSNDGTSDFMAKLVNLPSPIYKLVVRMIKSLDRKGNLPKDIVDINPYARTCFISNLGSIKMDADYHHLSNFGSNSFFAILGKKESKPFFNGDGSYTMKKVLPISLTIDERIADGLYFANTIKLFKAYMMRPELLEKPANESIDMISVQQELGL